MASVVDMTAGSHAAGAGGDPPHQKGGPLGGHGKGDDDPSQRKIISQASV